MVYRIVDVYRYINGTKAIAKVAVREDTGRRIKRRPSFLTPEEIANRIDNGDHFYSFDLKRQIAVPVIFEMIEGVVQVRTESDYELDDYLDIL